MLRKVLSLELSSGVFSASEEPGEAVTPGVDALDVCSDATGEIPEEDEGILEVWWSRRCGSGRASAGLLRLNGWRVSGRRM